MNFTLGGLRDVSRTIQARIEDLETAAKRGIEEELLLIQANIQAHRGTGSLAPHVKVDLAEKKVYLEYEMGDGKVTARDYHNPASKRYALLRKGQPFQDVLRDLGYEDVEPAPGAPIPVSSGDAPGIRITATITPAVLKRILKR